MTQQSQDDTLSKMERSIHMDYLTHTGHHHLSKEDQESNQEGF